MKLLHFTIIKLTLCLIAGILTASFITVPVHLLISCCIILMVILLISLLISKNKIQKTVWFGIITYLTTICIGILVVNLHDQRQFKTHYSNIISVETDSSRLLSFKIREVLKPTAYHDKYVIDLLKIDNISVSGKLLLNVQKDSLSNALQVDDVLATSSTLSELNRPLNPYQFDYKNYLSKRYIEHQISVDKSELIQIRSKANTIYGFAAELREKIDQKLKLYNFRTDELAIIDALLLGQRKDISQDTYNNYVNAGAIHILAVSGLHVGIILLMLNWLFKPIEWIKYGKLIKTILLVLILCGFAIIAGLSPSVMRAVGMFIVVAIGMNLNRPANIYNTLAISMLFLLLFKPLFLFDVGFQMSYAAVLAIASIKPILAGLWYPKLKLVNYFWQLICVTTAAQIGVVPISLFYFHQFPGLFFLSNLVILPFLGFILGFGIIVIILGLINLLPPFIAHAFGFCISTMNDFVSWVSQQESFIFRNISFGILFILVSYILIISVFSYFKRPHYQRLISVLVAVLILQGAFIFKKHQIRTNEFIIFHKSKFTLIGMKQNETLTVSDNLDSFTKTKDMSIRNYKVGNSIKTIESSGLKSIYGFHDEKLLIVDSLGIYNVKSFIPNYVLLRNSPKINLNRLIDSIHPKLIIADGSNYKSYVQRWKVTCEKEKIPFHQTSEKGAFILKY
ncbi:MAG: ComEC/Rec2 family competence protein [Gelidibacter sp.]